MDASLYEVLEMQLVCTAKSFTRSGKTGGGFTPIFNEYYQTICGSAEEVGLHYISQLEETELAGKIGDEPGNGSYIGLYLFRYP